MSQIKNQFINRPKVLWGLGVAFVAFLVITMVPFSYSVTTGYTATFENVRSFDMGTLGALKSSLESLGYDDVALNRHNDQMVMSGFASLNDARQAAVAFNLVTGYNGKAEIEPIIEEVSGSLYAQAINRLTIEVETAGKSDEEIATEIGQKLAAQGLLNSDVTVSTDGDMRNIQINYEGGNEHGEVIQEMQFKFDSGNDIAIEHSLSPEPMAIDTEGKTDQEIIDEVKANLSAQGVSNAQVTVHTRPDGKREIQVEAEKEVIK